MSMVTERKRILLRLDPAVYDALVRWAGDELRSTTAQIEFVLRRALGQVGRLPGEVGELPRRGRPPRADNDAADGGEAGDAAPDEPSDDG
ncbi:MAG TPA: hypothetical protein VGM10_27425 [Actinocrinis sp.]|jgi:hypothetical protein